MNNRISGPKGTRDIFPPDSYKIQTVQRVFQDVAHRFGYILVHTPLFERTDLFARKFKKERDIVARQMYTFPDHRGRSLTLRPEGSAGIMRSLIEAGIYPEGYILKYHYIGNMYRYIPVEKGRYREFSQVGGIAIGSSDPHLDAEQISLAHTLLSELDIEPIVVTLNSMGGQVGKKAYIKILEEFLYEQRENLCTDCHDRTVHNPMSVFLCEQDQCKTVLRDSPRCLDHISDEDKREFEGICRLLDELGIYYRVDPALVTGFSYQSRALFSIQIEGTEYVEPLMRGGRFDDLFRLLGGHSCAAVGFEGNVDRIIEHLPDEHSPDLEKLLAGEIIVIAMDSRAYREAFSLSQRLRKLRFKTSFDITMNSGDQSLIKATQQGVKRALMLGADEVDDAVVIVKALDKNKAWRVPLDRFGKRPTALAALEGIGGKPIVEKSKPDVIWGAKRRF